MLKIIGICCILCGAFAGIWTWNIAKKEKIRCIEEITDFLRRAENAVEQQTPVIDFLKAYTEKKQDEVPGEKNPFCSALQELAAELEKYEWSSGEEAWKAVLHQNRDLWSFQEEQWDAVNMIGQIAGGRNKNAILEILAQTKGRFLEMEREERRRLSEQRKVMMPVGMLAGVMLVLLFL